VTRTKRASGGGSAGRQRARVFWSGRSQAVRLPKAFRFSTKEVHIRQDGRSVVLEPVEIERDEKGWPRAWWSLAGSAPDFDVGDRQASHERGDVLAGRDD
jgi:virulence-associated protein VagC